MAVLFSLGKHLALAEIGGVMAQPIGSDTGMKPGNLQKPRRYADLPLRVVSALALAAVAVFCTVMGGSLFSVMAVAISAVIFIEFCMITHAEYPLRLAVAGGILLGLLFISAFVGLAPSALSLVLIGAIILALWERVTARSNWVAIGVVYAALPFVAMIGVRAGEHGLFLILFIFACVWGADSLAYFSGKTFGGPKLAPRISPNKTWSGFMGGIAGAVLVSVALQYGYKMAFSVAAVGLAAGLSLFSQLGDLFESWIKRRFGKKDSSRLIPGHGGLLDRIDGFIFATVAAWLIAVTLSPGAMFANGVSDELFATFFIPPR